MDPYFLSWQVSKYSLDEHYESHPGSIDIDINEIYLIPYGITISVPTYIYISTNNDSLYSLDTVNLSELFVTENSDPSFDRYNPLAEDFKIHRTTSKYPDTNTASTTEYIHNNDTTR